jgi:hypothetical protein
MMPSSLDQGIASKSSPYFEPDAQKALRPLLRSSDPGDDHRSPSPEAGQDLVSDEIVQKGFEVVSLASAANVIVQRAMSVDEACLPH